MIDREDMLRKVKIRQQIPPEDTGQDAMICLMMDDAVSVVKDYCHLRALPDRLEYMIREIVCQAIENNRGNNVASVKRGDTQINYNVAISAENFTERQRKVLNSYRRIRIG